jgi:glycosyltransferase involved in cell wall biosynthesis
LAALRVLFDTQAFRHQQYGGISRYYAELIRLLPSYGIEPVVRLPPLDNQHAIVSGLSDGRWARTLTAHPILRWFYYWGLGSYDHVWAAIENYDVLHRTYYAMPWSAGKPSVCTVVDMIPEALPHYFPEGNPHMHKREVVRDSDLVLSISESTSRDLVRFYGCSPRQVVTVPLGIDAEAFTQQARMPHPFRRPYILFVGMRHRYKNFGRFATAAARVLAAHDVSLALVGGGPLQDGEREVFAKAGVAERVVQASVSDTLLPTIYKEAEMFVFPSEYEGFGLPILESFASSCPVVASRASCFPEVGGEAMEYFDPYAPDDIAQAMERVLLSPTRAKELRRLGSERVKAYSWQRTAELTAAAYNRLS